MSMSQKPAGLSEADPVPNGPGAAAILAAGVGCATLGILAMAGDASPTISKLLIFYNPTGALSGVTTVSIIVWLASWFVLPPMADQNGQPGQGQRGGLCGTGNWPAADLSSLHGHDPGQVGYGMVPAGGLD